jgi:hypothetical protein
MRRLEAVMQRIRMVVAGSAALAMAAACSPPAPSAADDALRADLAAAQATARPAERTQFVSPLELGRVAEPRANAVPMPRAASTAPARVATTRRSRAVSPSATRVARPVARVRPPEPAPAREVADVDDAPAVIQAPRPAATPAPEPARGEPVVAVPSRRPGVESPPPPRRPGRVWDMGDVIRNAPFPIKP